MRIYVCVGANNSAEIAAAQAADTAHTAEMPSFLLPRNTHKISQPLVSKNLNAYLGLVI